MVVAVIHWLAPGSGAMGGDLDPGWSSQCLANPTVSHSLGELIDNNGYLGKLTLETKITCWPYVLG